MLSIRKTDIDEYDDAFRSDPLLAHTSGRISHLCFEDDDRYVIVDVWESREAFDAFQDHLDVKRPGRRDPEHRLYPGRFRVHRVHNLIVDTGAR